MVKCESCTENKNIAECVIKRRNIQENRIEFVCKQCVFEELTS